MNHVEAALWTLGLVSPTDLLFPRSYIFTLKGASKDAIQSLRLIGVHSVTRLKDARKAQVLILPHSSSLVRIVCLNVFIACFSEVIARWVVGCESESLGSVPGTPRIPIAVDERNFDIVPNQVLEVALVAASSAAGAFGEIQAECKG